MKIIERMSLTIFSTIVLILSLLFCLILFNWLDVNDVYWVLQYVKSIPTATNVGLGVSVVLILLAVKCIFFPANYKQKQDKTEGILLENETGTLMISVETVENLVKSVVSEFSNIKSANCKVKLDKQVNNIIIDLNLVVASETIIKELSANLQKRIKEIIKTTTEIEVKEVNIKIKNIEAQKVSE